MERPFWGLSSVQAGQIHYWTLRESTARKSVHYITRTHNIWAKLTLLALKYRYNLSDMFHVHTHSSLFAGDRLQDPLPQGPKRKTKIRELTQSPPRKNQYLVYFLLFIFLWTNIEMWTASSFPSSPVPSLGTARCSVPVWSSYPLKGPSEILLFWGRARELGNRKVQTREKRGINVRRTDPHSQTRL